MNVEKELVVDYQNICIQLAPNSISSSNQCCNLPTKGEKGSEIGMDQTITPSVLVSSIPQADYTKGNSDGWSLAPFQNIAT